jgi:hypothetical protein
MGEMRVTYRYQPEDIIRAYKNYFEDSPDGKKLIRSLFLIYSLLLALPLVLISMIVAANYGFSVGITVYILFCIACFIFGKGIVRKWTAKREAKNVERILADEEITMLLTDSSIEVSYVNGMFNYKWQAIEHIERCGLLLLFRIGRRDFVVPCYGFDEKERFEEFCDMAKEYYENHKKLSESPPPKKAVSTARYTVAALLFPVLGLLILVSAMETRSTTSPEEVDVVDECMSFWKEALQNDFDNSIDYRMKTSDGFKKRISEDEWKGILKVLSQRIGKLKDIKTLSYQSWRDPKTVSIPFVRFRLSAELDKAKVIARITGDKDRVYVRSFLEEGAWWRLNGFDVIAATGTKLQTDSYSTEDDQKLFSDGQEDSKEIVCDAEKSAIVGPD